jgi:hypothetical protein
MDGLREGLQQSPAGLGEQELERLVRAMDWRVVSGDKPPSDLTRFHPLVRFVRAAERVRDQAFAGMVLAEEAMAFGLASFQIDLVAESVYDDHGGYHRDVSIRVRDVRLVEGALPETPAMKALLEECFGEGLPTDAGAAQELADAVSNALPDVLQDRAYELYEALTSDPAEMSDFTLRFDRSKAGALLADEPSGHAVFAAICPRDANEALAELAEAASAVPEIARQLI